MTKKSKNSSLSADTARSGCSRGRTGSISSKIRVGIIGLPNVGKSSLFNALARRSQAQCENFPFCTIEPNIAQVAIPDPYLRPLGKLAKTHKTVPATMEFVDVAGLVPGASRGEGLGNQFLGNIRECDAIIHLLRNYEDNRIVHVVGEIDPAKDAETVNTELRMADIAHIERRLEKRNCRGGEREVLETLLLPKLKAGIPARACGILHAAQFSIRSMGLLTLKPVLYAFNVSRHAFLFEREKATVDAKATLEKLRCRSNDTTSSPKDDDNNNNDDDLMIALVSAKMEANLSKLPMEQELDRLHNKHGVDPSMDEEIKHEMSHISLPLLLQELLGIGLLYTGPGVPPSRTSATKVYTFRLQQQQQQQQQQQYPPTAGQLAAAVHGDLQKGFIKAKVVPADTLLAYENFAAARDAGLVKTEGKDHLLQNHDVVLIKWK